MRLTLRTLLAYLDDILEPNRAKEIGEKINDSDVASAVVARIRDVMRRRRVAAPEIDGPASGLDPNKVAEYLDNTLEPSGVADVERVCLESDVHLAEVAACHQILTLVLGEPVDIPPESRERMYALAPRAAAVSPASDAMPPADTVAATAPEPKEKPAPAAKPTRAQPTPKRSFQESIPDYLKRRPVWKRALPFLIVVGLLAAFIGLVATDPSFNVFSKWFGGEGQKVAANPNGNPQQPAEPAAESGKTDAGTAAKTAAAPVTPQQTPGVVVASKTTDPDMPPLPMGVDGNPPPDKPEQSNKPATTVVAPMPKTVTPQVASTEPKATTPNSPTPKTTQPGKQPAGAPAGDGPRLRYAPTSGLLLQYFAKHNDWAVLPARSMIHPQDRLAVPHPFEAVFDLEGGKLETVMLPGTAATFMGKTDAGDFGFQLHRGRLLLSAGKSDDKAAEPVVLALKIRSQQWQLELRTAEAACAIEMQTVLPTQFEKRPAGDEYTGRLIVLKGTVRFAAKDGSSIVHDADQAGPGAIPLAPSQLTAALATGTAQPEKTPPAWTTTEGRALSSVARRYATLFQKEFAPLDGNIGGVQLLSLTVPPIVDDRRPAVSELAVRALAVTASVPGLVRALAQSSHEESRQAAIDGLRSWLPVSPENGKTLLAELKKVFPAKDVNPIYRLLWGYDSTDAADAATSGQLVDWMDHDQSAVRQLAFMHVHRLTGRRLGYRHNLSPQQRKVAVDRWRLQLQKDGALVKQ